MQMNRVQVEKHMGTYFDPNMEAVFIGCRAELEEYYRQNN